MLAPELEKLASRLGETVRVAKLDSDAEPQLSSELRVQGLPTLVFYRPGPGGLAECHRVEGMPGGADALQALVQRHLR
jgi:thioredoxin-like negative regulator of GroEL